MKSFPYSLFVFALALYGLVINAHGQGKKPVIPANAVQVVKVLPVTLEGWKVVHSSAETYLVQTLQTTAVRKFEEKTEGDADPGSAVGKMEISITDTGSFPGAMAEFVDFKEGAEGPVEKKFVKSYPAISLSLGEEHRLSMLVDRRFVVEFVYQGLKDKELDDWIDAVDYQSIQRLPNGGAYKDETRDIEVMRVSQKKGGKTSVSKYSMHVVSAADLDKQLARAARMDQIIQSNGGLDEPAPPGPDGKPARGPKRP